MVRTRFDVCLVQADNFLDATQVYEELADVRLCATQKETRSSRLGQAKNAFEHLNGFHLQERYLVGTLLFLLCFSPGRAHAVHSALPPTGKANRKGSETQRSRFRKAEKEAQRRLEPPD